MRADIGILHSLWRLRSLRVRFGAVRRSPDPA